MQKGEIKFYLKEKGYGFITPEGAKESEPDVFFHWTALKCDATKKANIQEGDKVEYEIEMDEKKKKEKAINVNFIED